MNSTKLNLQKKLKTWPGIELAINHFNRYTRMFSGLLWNCKCIHIHASAILSNSSNWTKISSFWKKTRFYFHVCNLSLFGESTCTYGRKVVHIVSILQCGFIGSHNFIYFLMNVPLNIRMVCECSDQRKDTCHSSIYSWINGINRYEFTGNNIRTAKKGTETKTYP